MSQYDGQPQPGHYDNPSNHQSGNGPAQGYPGYGGQHQAGSSYSGPSYGQPPGSGNPGPFYGQQQAGPYGGQLVAVPEGTHIDPAVGVVIPNGTEVASTGRRIGAYFLGILLVFVTLGIGYAIWGLVEWSKGRTPVQRVLGLRCYKENEFRTFGWGDMFLREFIYWICSVIWPVQIANFVVFLVNGKRQGLHDMASSCIVLHDPNNKVLG